MSTHDVVMLSTIGRWFERRRGVMTGVVKVGIAVGQVVLPPIMALLIVLLGWQMAVVSIGICATILLISSAMMMTSPEVSTPETAVQDSPGMSFRAACRTRLFWRLCVFQFLFFPTLMTVPVHLAVHGMDLGMNAGRAALLLSVLGAASIAGRLVIGLGADRLGGKKAFILSFIPLIASLFTFVITTAHLPLFLVVALYGFAHGGLFTLVSPVVAEYFGMRAHGSIFGIIVFFGTIGGSIGPILAGWSFDLLGSYQPTFIGLGLMTCLGLIMAPFLPASPQLSQKVRGRALPQKKARVARNYLGVSGLKSANRSNSISISFNSAIAARISDVSKMSIATRLPNL
jgi:MFS family permease